MPLDVDNQDCRTEGGVEQTGERMSKLTFWGAHTRLEKVQTLCYLKAIRKLGRGVILFGLVHDGVGAARVVTWCRGRGK